MTAIVDHNKIQSDTWVRAVSDLGDLEAKFAAFGWHVLRCDGHDMPQLDGALAAARDTSDRPSIIIADTVKGKGVSFMEGPSMPPDDQMYHFHSGAPTADQVRQRPCGAGRDGQPAARDTGRWSPTARDRRASAGPPPLGHPAAYPGVRPGAGRAGGAQPEPARPGCRPRTRLRADSVPRQVSGAVRGVRHRREGHGLDRERPRVEGAPPGRSLVLVLSIYPPERTDLQQRDRATTNHLRGIAGRAVAGGARTLPPMRA